MFPSALFLLCVALIYAREIRLYGDMDKNHSIVKFSDITKLEKVLESNFRKTYRILRTGNAWLRKNSELLNRVMAKLIKDQALIEVAHGKHAEQSSTLGFLSQYSESQAVDGNTSTFSITSYDNNPYFWVDLKQEYTIIRIEIFSREDCCGGYFHDVGVTVGKSLKYMELCEYFTGPAKTNEHIVLYCKVPLIGRFVKLCVTKGNAYLQIAELKVFAHREL